MSIFNPLLTRDERKTLDKPAKQALRDARRAERKAQRGGLLVNIPKLVALAEDMILERLEDEVPGPEKMDEVLDDLLAEADKVLTFSWAGFAAPALEWGSDLALGLLFREVVRPYVQKAYDELAARDFEPAG